MPVSVKKRGNQYCVVEPDGTVKKCYSSKQAAMKYMAAININTHAEKTEGQEMLVEPQMPKMVIVSDGDFSSTRLFVRGQELQVNEVWLTAKKGDPNSEYEWEQKDEFSLSLSTSRVVDGMEQTVTLRMREKASAEAEAIFEYTPVSVHEAVAKLLAAKKPKRDPNAKVRNRGDVVFPAGSSKIKDDKDHFPINNPGQARNALSRVMQFSSAPSWYSGSLSELQNKVRSAVKRKYPNIEVTEPKKKKE